MQPSSLDPIDLGPLHIFSWSVIVIQSVNPTIILLRYFFLGSIELDDLEEWFVENHLVRFYLMSLVQVRIHYVPQMFVKNIKVLAIV